MIVLTLLSGCNLRERAAYLDNKEQQLQQREQQLNERETALKEKELLQKQLDSLPITDSLLTVDSTILGTWNVRMRCTQTTCMGSAIGDEKNEIWTISLEKNQVVVRASVAGNITRIYAGTMVNDKIELSEQTEQLMSAPIAKINVVLFKRNDKLLEGEREIVKQDCTILYTLQLTRQSF